MTISKHDTDLGGGRALLGQPADILDDLVGRRLEPRGHRARVGDRRRGDAFAFAVQTAHGGGLGRGKGFVIC